MLLCLFSQQEHYPLFGQRNNYFNQLGGIHEIIRSWYTKVQTLTLSHALYTNINRLIYSCAHKQQTLFLLLVEPLDFNKQAQ